MLVLSRQRDETIMIGDDIELTVVDIRGDKVRLGIKAAPEIAIHRKEVYDAIKRENEQAAQLAEGAVSAFSENIKPTTTVVRSPVPAAKLSRRPDLQKRATA
ncbi:MAG: carbon storage regulator CsrA [Planctomycetes bacterium]|nr:carbon storage regulator CsrA [Planctomycetota bacterium]